MIVRRSSHVVLGTGLGLAFAFGATAPIAAQLTPQAIYPLLTDLLDATTNYGPITLSGNPTPPNNPMNGVCVNGIYSFSAGGQNVQTPMITTLDTNDFEIDLEFQVAAFPTGFGAPVLMAGNLYRFLGIYVDPTGFVGIKHNNSNLVYSTLPLTLGNWYLASLRYEAGTAELHIDGVMVLQVAVGPLNTGNNLNFTTNDFSNARAFNGCLRNLIIANDTTLGAVASATNYGTGCDGLTLVANGVPAIGNLAFELDVTNVPVVSVFGFVAFGTLALNPGVDLTPFGFGGCFAYTNLDLGLFGPAVVTSGTAVFALPIPNNASLAGSVLSAQGLSFSAATAIGLATSNGTLLVVGF